MYSNDATKGAKEHTISHATTQAAQAPTRRETFHWARLLRPTTKAKRKRLTRTVLISGNVLLLLLAIFFVHRFSGNGLQGTTVANQVQANPLDQLSSADIAVNLAQMANLPETTAVSDQAITVDSELAVTSADTTVVAKPQQVVTNYASRSDIQSYVAQDGDSAASIAAKFNLNVNSIMWSNGLASNKVAAGTKLAIPPLNGIVYTVKSGDTAGSLAQKYQSNEAQIVSYNDAEISGLQPGEQIIIPGGQQPAGASVLHGLTSGSGISTATYGGFGTCHYAGKSYSNYGYDCGFCTWWVAMRRATTGSPVPSNLGDARSWRSRALSVGMSEGTTPRAGAVMWFTDDHVGYVESVADDGTTTISEMNHKGWGIENERTFAPDDASSHTYIY